MLRVKDPKVSLHFYQEVRAPLTYALIRIYFAFEILGMELYAGRRAHGGHHA